MKIRVPTVKPRNPFYRDLMVLKSKKVKPKKGKGSYKRSKVFCP